MEPTVHPLTQATIPMLTLTSTQLIISTRIRMPNLTLRVNGVYDILEAGAQRNAASP